MALLRPVGCSIRRSDKEVGWLDPYDDLFDQYVESGPFELSQQNLHSSSCDDGFASLFDGPTSSDSDHEFETIPGSEVQRDCDADWGTILQSVEDDHVSRLYSESSGKAVVSAPEFPALNKPLAHRPRPGAAPLSTPASPSRSKIGKTRSGDIVQPQPSRIIKDERTGSQSPKMEGTRTAYQGVWAKRIEAAADKFDLQLSRGNTPYSPPPSVDLANQHDDHWFNQPRPSGHPLDAEISPRSTDFGSRTQAHMTPMSSPSAKQRLSRQLAFIPNSAPVVAGYNGSFNALQTPPQTNPLPSSSWPNESAAPLDFSFHGSPTFKDWTSTGADQPRHDPQHAALMALSLNDAEQSDLAHGGLLIQCDPNMHLPYPPLASPTREAPMFPNYNYAVGQYTPTATTTPSHLIVRPGERSPSASPPPPITPTRSSRRSRSKSRSYSHHRRSKSISNNAAAPRQEASGFVNYTPDDSKKILTGVAPSGSSKTKARREKEAAEKRRKLSLAATKAIVDAGGDPTALEKEGLLLDREG